MFVVYGLGFSLNQAASSADALMATQQQRVACCQNSQMTSNGKLQDLQTQMQQAVNAVNQRVAAAESQVATSALEQQALNLQRKRRTVQIQPTVQTVAINKVTKVDLAEALKQAMDSQAQNICHMLQIKRSPDASPQSETKASYGVTFSVFTQ